MATYPETKLDRAIDAAIRRTNAAVIAKYCTTCLGTTRVYIDGEQRTCTACDNGKKRAD